MSFSNAFCGDDALLHLFHQRSIILHVECRVRYIIGCLCLLSEEEYESMNSGQAPHDSTDSPLQGTLDAMVWSERIMDRCDENVAWRVTTMSPGRVLNPGQWTRKPNADEYRLGLVA